MYKNGFMGHWIALRTKEKVTKEKKITMATAASPLFTEYSADQFLDLGLRMRGQKNWDKTRKEAKIDYFRSTFGTHPLVLSLIWRDLHTSPFQECRISDKSVTPQYLVLTFRWLTSYESEKELKTNFGFDEKTTRKYCQLIVEKVASLRKMKIDPNFQDDDDLMLCQTVDGVHFPIEEPRPFSKKYKSTKLGGAGLTYTLSVFTHKDKIVWMEGPYPAATNDKTIFRDKLKGAIEQKQQERGNDYRVIADDGYVAHDLLDTLTLRNEWDPHEIAWFKDRALSRQERLHAMVETFKCMTVKFRHDRGWNPNHQHPQHKACLVAICVTIQYELDAGISSLFDPYPE